MRRLSIILLAASALMAAPLAAGAAPAPAVNHDPAATESGAYTLDGRHAALLIKIGHNNGVSWSVFRFDKLTGSLDWNAAQPAASKLTMTVDPKSITTPSQGFAEELADEYFLNTDKYPTATFVSKSAVQTAPGRGRLSGDFTFYGTTRPITFDVEFIGSGGNARAKTLGFRATGKFNRADHGYKALLGPVGNEVQIEFDGEFIKPTPAPPAPPPAPATPR